MPESCNSRSLSWLVKSCIPDDPRRDIAGAPERDHRKTPVSAAAALSPISALPDDLLLECLSRLPISSLPALTLVSRRFSLLLHSPAFLHLRRLRARLLPTLLALSVSDLGLLVCSSLPLATADPAWDSSAAPIAASFPTSAFSHPRIAVIDRTIFILGRTAALRHDTWTGTTRSISPTLYPRKKFAAAAVGGKIYVAGGAGKTSAVEEYDPDLDTWRVVAEAPRRRYGCVGAAAGGVFYVIGGLPVGGDGGACAGSMDAYHVAGGGWLRSRPAVPGGGCVVGACGAGAHLYVVASHAVEVMFWRWEGGGRRQRGEGWVRLEGPPVAAGGLGRGGAVRFSCATVGEAKVVALVHRRGGGDVGEGMVLVYDIAGDEWSRRPDLGPGLRRTTCAVVEC